MFRKSLLLLIATLMICISANYQVEAAQTQYITIQNNTGRMINVVYCWAGDVTPKNLLTSPMTNGESASIRIDPEWAQNRNFQIFFPDGDSRIWRNRDFRGISYIVLYKDSDGDIAMDRS